MPEVVEPLPEQFGPREGVVEGVGDVRRISERSNGNQSECAFGCTAESPCIALALSSASVATPIPRKQSASYDT